AVTRVVRLDRSGTTQITKNYLVKVDSARTGTTCQAGTPWSTFAQDANNTVWPSGAGCSTLDPQQGNPGAANELKNHSGAVAYLDISDASSRKLKFVNVHPASGTKYQSPLAKNATTGKKTQANCDLSAATLPSGGANGAVGLNAADGWATNNASGNHG